MAGRNFSADRAEKVQGFVPFELGGEEFSVQLPLPVITLLELAEEDAAKATQAFLNAFKVYLGDEQYERFRSAAVRERLDENELLAILNYITEESTGFPTEQRSDSAVSSSTITQPSPVVAYSQGQATS